MGLLADCVTTALIDADIACYRAASGNQASFDWGDTGGKVTVGNDKEAIESGLQTIAAWAALAKCDKLIAAFSGAHNFRKTILPTYKANRKGGKPPSYWAVVEAVKREFPSHCIDGLEADDVLGILATTDRFIDNAVVVSVDKDLKSIPGRVLNPVKDTKPSQITEAAADRAWLMQALMGDMTDGYSGIPGVGPKRANAVLCGSHSLASMWRSVIDAYRSARLTETDALTMARVARILRRQDYDKTTKEVLLWHPTCPVRLPLASVTGTPEKLAA